MMRSISISAPSPIAKWSAWQLRYTLGFINLVERCSYTTVASTQLSTTATTVTAHNAWCRSSQEERKRGYVGSMLHDHWQRIGLR